MADRRRAIVEMWPYLQGCTEGLHYPTKKAARAAIAHLNSCRAHRGVHHFAVVGEGKSIAISVTGLECLRKAGLA